MLRLLFATILVTTLGLVTQHSPHFSPGPELKRYAQHHPGCGVPVGPESWHHGAFSQQYVGCVLYGSIHLTRAGEAAPTPTATFSPPPPPPPTATPIPSNTPAPTATPVPLPACPGTGCVGALLAILNADRAAVGVPPLVLSFTLSDGTGACVGAVGHSLHMAQVGSISHDQFPSDACGFWTRAGENVGEASYGNELADIQAIDASMLSEPHDPATCAASSNHACSILNPQFHFVGIGLVESGGATWLTEDFTD